MAARRRISVTARSSGWSIRPRRAPDLRLPHDARLHSGDGVARHSGRSDRMTFMRRLFGDSWVQVGLPSDARALAQLVESGVDISVPRSVDFDLTFRDERAARQTVAVLAGLGGDLRIGAAAGGFEPRWLVRLTLPMAITPERLAAMRGRLEELAAERGGR